MPDYAPPRISLPPVIAVDPFNHPLEPPPPGAAPLPPPPPTAAEKPPRRGKRGLLIVGIAVIVLAIGGGAFGFYFWQQQQVKPAPTPTPTPTPTVSADQLLQQAWAAWTAVKSYHASVRVTAETTAIEGTKYAAEMQQSGFSDLKFSASLDATTDVTLAGPPQGSADIKLTIPLGNTIPASPGEVITPEIGYLVLDKNTMYFKIDNLPILAKVGWDGLTGQWVKVDAATLAQPSATGTPALTGADFQAEFQRQLASLGELYRQYPFFSVERVAGVDTQDSVPTDHLRLSFQRDQFKQFYAASWQVIQPAVEKTGENVMTSMEEVNKAANDFADNLQLTVELWIGQTDKLVRRVAWNATATLLEEGVNQGTLTINGDVQLSQYGEPVVVTAPAESISVQEYIGLIMGKVIGMTMNAAANEAKKDSDRDGLTDAMEQKIGTDPTQSDTDGDSYSDGTEVENGYNPLGSGSIPADMQSKLQPEIR